MFYGTGKQIDIDSGKDTALICRQRIPAITAININFTAAQDENIIAAITVCLHRIAQAGIDLDDVIALAAPKPDRFP